MSNSPPAGDHTNQENGLAGEATSLTRSTCRCVLVFQTAASNGCGPSIPKEESCTYGLESEIPDTPCLSQHNGRPRRARPATGNSRHIRRRGRECIPMQRSIGRDRARRHRWWQSTPTEIQIPALQIHRHYRFQYVSKNTPTPNTAQPFCSRRCSKLERLLGFRMPSLRSRYRSVANSVCCSVLISPGWGTRGFFHRCYLASKLARRPAVKHRNSAKRTGRG
jgi:hypothetical protein